jgi:RES domain-containing protein
MIITAWRVSSRRRARTAFSGQGSKYNGERWNSKGFKVVYTSDTQSLAMLETLIHLTSYSDLHNRIIIPVYFDDIFVMNIDPKSLPKNWQAGSFPKSTQKIGDKWVKAVSSAVLCVPSTVMPAQFNYLLNPEHPDFPQIRVGMPKNLVFDPRLIKKIKLKP